MSKNEILKKKKKLDVFEKAPRKQYLNRVILVHSNRTIVLRMCFCANLRHSRKERVYFKLFMTTVSVVICLFASTEKHAFAMCIVSSTCGFPAIRGLPLWLDTRLMWLFLFPEYILSDALNSVDYYMSSPCGSIFPGPTTSRVVQNGWLNRYLRLLR